MADVFCLEPEDDFPEIFGIVSSLPPWKMCYLISKVTNLELIHEDVAENSPPPIQIIEGAVFVTFERYVWFSEENEQFIHLIQNKVVSNIEVDKGGDGSTLFRSEETNERTFTLLQEWGQVNYLIRTEGCNDFFNPYLLKEEKWVRMVLKSTMDQFKNYDKII